MKDEPESIAEKTFRLRNEVECRKIAELLRRELSPGLGFVLLTCTYGSGKFSNTSYVATINRDDAARLLNETLDHWQENGVGTEPSMRTATFLRETVYSLREQPWRRLLHGARCSVRDAESALAAGSTEAGQREVLKACVELMTVYDQLARKVGE